ncbi:MAG: hypothetical protein ACFFCS_29905 [Candidatus Hodarchaeota archaeon]
MLLYVLAFILGLIGIIVIGVLFRRFGNKKIQRLIVDIAIILIFITILIANANSFNNWTPLNDFVQFFVNVSGTAMLFNLIFLVFYILSGFALGTGFIQLMKLGEYQVRISSRNLSIKRMFASVLKLIEIYVIIVVILAMVYALIDLFGILYVADSLRQVLDYMMILPLIWYYLGIFTFCFKYWRNGRYNLDFISVKPKRNLNPEKIRFHKVVTVFLVGISYWVFVLFEYYSVFPHPGKFLFCVFLFIGFNINYTKEIPIKEV